MAKLANSLPVCASKPTLRRAIKNAWWTLGSAMKIGGSIQTKWQLCCGQDKHVTPVLISSVVQLALVLWGALNKSRRYLKDLRDLNARLKQGTDDEYSSPLSPGTLGKLGEEWGMGSWPHMKHMD